MAAPSLDPSPPSAEPSWDDIRIFLAVVAHGSMNGAAKALGQSQPTIARRIRALEDQLGVPLFDRGPNHLALTAGGRAVLEAASPMAEAARGVPLAAAAHRPNAHTPVRITATASVTMFLSLHAIALAEAAGGIEVDFIPTRRKLDLAAGQADIALRMRQVADADALVCRRLGAVGFALYESVTNPSGAIIGPSDDPNLSRQAAYIAEFAQGRAIAARIGDMPIRYQAAKAGLGAAFLPCWLGDRDPDLVRIGAPPQELLEDVYLVMVERGRVRPAVSRVADALAAVFKQHQDALLGRG